MYIKKYWYNYIGGTDDSLTLVDYLYDKGKTEIPLSEIFNDTGLSKLNWNFHISPNLEYIDSEGQCHEFYYAIDLATDLAALILESKKSGGFNIKNLFDGEKRDRFVKIITTPEEDQAMNRALAEFCASPLEYDLHEMADDEDMQMEALKKQGIKAYKRFRRFDETERKFKIKKYLFSHGFSSGEIDAFLNGEVIDLSELAEY